MSFDNLEIGKVGLIQQRKDGTIFQIGLTQSQSKLLQVFLSELSKDTPLYRMNEEYDLILKTEIRR